MNFKNPFVKEPKKSIPLPRIIGNALQMEDGLWSWELDIFIGQEYVASLSHPKERPGFLTKQGAIEALKEQVQETSKLIGKQAYNLSDEELSEIMFFDNNTNSMIDKL